MDRYQQMLSSYENVSVTKQLATGDDYTSTAFALIAGKTGHRIFVQKIRFSVTTPDKAKSVTIEDTTPTLVGKINATSDPSDVASTPGPREIDFGADGYGCAVDKGLELKNSATGIVMAITVEAYRKRTANLVGNATTPANAPINSTP